jgi:hypothetical protein
MNDAASGSEHLFVVRLRTESIDDGVRWRGYVEHVPSGRHLHFADLVDLTDFITLRAGERRVSRPEP